MLPPCPVLGRAAARVLCWFAGAVHSAEMRCTEALLYVGVTWLPLGIGGLWGCMSSSPVQLC